MPWILEPMGTWRLRITEETATLLRQGYGGQALNVPLVLVVVLVLAPDLL